MADVLAQLLSIAYEVIPEEDLAAKLAAGRPLRVKLGIDPSRPDLHLGHAVVLRTLRRFQDLGHQAVLIIGDFTGRVGDPSGQSATRPFLGPEEIEANARTYLEQAGLVMDMDRAEVRRNSEWLGEMDMGDVLALASKYTVARMLERDDFAKRYSEGRPISVVEFLYPLMQAWDSVRVHADVELGGTDQKFNLLLGRDLQREEGQDPQVVMTMPLLVGTDGVRKMSKSYDNYVGLTDSPDEMFGRVMRIPDEVIGTYARLCTDRSPEEIEELEGGLASGSLHPNDEKRRVAREIVDLYHGVGAGAAAEERFNQVHRERETPEDVPETGIPEGAVRDGRVWLPKLLVATGLASSNSEARRLVSQGGVRLGGKRLGDPDAELDPVDIAGKVLQVGRRKFVRFR